MEPLNFEKVISIRFKDKEIVAEKYDENAKQILLKEAEEAHYHIYQIEAKFNHLKESLAPAGINVLSFIENKRHEGYSTRVYEELFIEVGGNYYLFDTVNECDEMLVLMNPLCFKYDGESMEVIREKVPLAIVSLVKTVRENMVKSSRYKKEYESGKKQVQICS